MAYFLRRPPQGRFKRNKQGRLDSTFLGGRSLPRKGGDLLSLGRSPGRTPSTKEGAGKHCPPWEGMIILCLNLAWHSYAIIYLAYDVLVGESDNHAVLRSVVWRLVPNNTPNLSGPSLSPHWIAHIEPPQVGAELEELGWLLGWLRVSDVVGYKFQYFSFINI